MRDNDRTDARPLVVCGPDGAPIHVLEENEKGFRKTVERGRLWALHPGTRRLLPFYETIAATIRENHGWYQARLAQLPDPDTLGADRSAAPTAPATADAEAVPPTAPAASASSARPAAPAVSTPSEPAASADIGAVLRDLATVIAERHAAMPEGSYTTHLFSSGAEKIRKKAGEEAIELLLASSREELVGETADFLYHVLVLLENEGISLAEIAAELDRR
ncbi:MAG: phosphoribosyl-ATP diphosphatase [Spirochaetota bacterium]